MKKIMDEFSKNKKTVEERLDGLERAILALQEEPKIRGKRFIELLELSTQELRRQSAEIEARQEKRTEQLPGTP